jgi:hypothetical protein
MDLSPSASGAIDLESLIITRELDLRPLRTP